MGFFFGIAKSYFDTLPHLLETREYRLLKSFIIRALADEELSNAALELFPLFDQNLFNTVYEAIFDLNQLAILLAICDFLMDFKVHFHNPLQILLFVLTLLQVIVDRVIYLFNKQPFLLVFLPIL